MTTDNIIRFPTRIAGKLIVTDERRRNFEAMCDDRVKDRPSPPVEVWIERGGASGSLLVTAVFRPEPGRGYAIDAAATFEPLAGYADLEIARTAGVIAAEWFQVPLVDHTQEGGAA